MSHSATSSYRTATIALRSAAPRAQQSQGRRELAPRLSWVDERGSVVRLLSSPRRRHDADALMMSLPSRALIETRVGAH